MTRNDMKKITFEDKWYKVYTKGAGHRQHKSDKHCNHRKFRRLNKKMIDNEKEMWYYNYRKRGNKMQNDKIILELEKEIFERRIEMTKQYCAESNINFYKLSDEDLLEIYWFLRRRAYNNQKRKKEE